MSTTSNSLIDTVLSRVASSSSTGSLLPKTAIDTDDPLPAPTSWVDRDEQRVREVEEEDFQSMELAYPNVYEPSGGYDRTIGGAMSGPSENRKEVTEPEKRRPRPVKKRRRAYSVRDELEPGPSTRTQPLRMSSSDVEIIALPGETSSSYAPIATNSSPSVPQTTITEPEPLASYACPICFSPPTNATLTPCGHVLCGECLFTAVRAALQRAPFATRLEPAVARCPVCRAILKGWDGRGAGVIGLKPRTIISL